MTLGIRKRGSPHSSAAFTLVEILVAVGVFAILGTALVGLMSAGVEAWRGGEAGRQVNEKLQALRRQIADDLAAAVVDLPPQPDYHFALDSAADLTDPASDPDSLVSAGESDPDTPVPDTSNGRSLLYFAPAAQPGTGTVLLRIRVPFPVRTALLKARIDVLPGESAQPSKAQLLVATNNPAAEDPALRDAVPADGDAAWKEVDYLEGEGIGGGETNISDALYRDVDGVRVYGDLIFVKAVLDNQSTASDAAQFLRADLDRPGGRPVLVLDCYRTLNAVPDVPRPTFAAWFKDGSQIVTFTRTLPLDVEQAAAGTSGFTGRAQVVYHIAPTTGSSGEPGLGVLRRAYRTPLPTTPSGGLQPYQLRPNVVRLVDDLIDPTQTPRVDYAFIPHVLHVGMSFWGPETTTWEMRPDLEPDYATKYTDDTRPHPPSADWLSSRYLPEQVQVTVVLEPEWGKRTATALAASFAADATGRLRVHSTRGFDATTRPADPAHGFLRDPRHFIKVGREWMYYDGVASDGAFTISERGSRGSVPAAHAAGAEVFRGVPTLFAVPIPASRSWER